MISGRYSLEREIGRGATGAVWLGRDETLGRPVALKRIGILPGTDQTDLARAEREARLSARLHHPHVVGVYDAVVDHDTGAWWLVMEHVDGPDLGRLVRERGPLTPDQTAHLMAQASDALAAAHAAGIVHRDVKPSNILLDPAGQVKLTDFGIARILSDPALTQTGLVTGSPAYLAPEVAAGGRGDAASDVWSLGATMFHVLAGVPPYDLGDNVLGGLYRIVHEEPPRPPDAGWLTPLLEATMERDLSRRWTMPQVHAYLTSGGDRSFVASELGQTGTLEAVPAPATTPTTTPSTASRTTLGRRRSPALLLAVVAVVLLAAVVGGYLLLSDRGSGSGSGGTPKAASPSSTPSAKTRAQPTAQGMESFIDDYVAAVSQDPGTSWKMLTPKFQQESGGFPKYQQHWRNATNGKVLSISTNVKTLTVAYQVHFDGIDNGPGPTVLELSYDKGRYLINGESTRGFKPAG